MIELREERQMIGERTEEVLEFATKAKEFTLEVRPSSYSCVHKAQVKSFEPYLASGRGQ